MTNLIRVEWLKMRKYNAFWWIFGATALSYPGINYMFYNVYRDNIEKPNATAQYAKMALGEPFSFPEVWHTVAYCSSIFVFIPAVLIIMFISNEYTYRTHRQNIIDGWSRSQFVTSKLIDVMMITLLITILYTGTVLVTGLTNKTGGLIDHTWEQAYYIGLFALQTFAQLTVAFLFGFLVKKAFLALGLFLFYFILLENVIVGLLNWQKIGIYKYFPLELSDRVIPMPGFAYMFNPERYQQVKDAIPLHIFLTIGLTAIIWLICYKVNNKRDLK